MIKIKKVEAGQKRKRRQSDSTMGYNWQWVTPGVGGSGGKGSFKHPSLPRPEVSRYLSIPLNVIKVLLYKLGRFLIIKGTL